MNQIQIEPQDNIAVLRLTHGVTNAITPEMVAELIDALSLVQKQYQGMVLAGGTKFFSMGLDLPVLLLLSRKEMIDFWRQFDRVVLDLYTLLIPTACAIAGHAIAGGTILATGCDFRYIIPGRCLMGINEMKIGLPVPYLTDMILRQLVGDRVATKMTYKGEFVEPEEAKATGLVDDIFPEADVETLAVAKVAGIAAGVPEAFAYTKRSRVAGIEREFKKYVESRLGRFLDCWFQPAGQKLLHKAAEKF
jgi:enoyl-CoA hydratase/carnithine racemase